MAVENHYHESAPSSDSSSMTVLVAIVAILVIVGLGAFALRSAGFWGAATTNNQPDVNINLEGQLPIDTTPQNPAQ